MRRRALGQHFLRDTRVARSIVDLLSPTSADLVVEIGPGQGALTGELSHRAGRVMALEVDRVLIERLRVALPGVEVLDADARAWDWASLARPADGRALVVGNLPYSVGTAILLALARAPQAIDRIVVMLQREVAERVAAAPGGKAYGSLSVHVQLRWRVELVMRVPPGAFRPPPKVESAVLRLTPLATPPVPLADEQRFEAVVRAAFAQRRKTLANALAAGLGLPVGAAREAAASAGVDPGRRAETLDIREFAEVARRL